MGNQDAKQDWTWKAFLSRFRHRRETVAQPVTPDTPDAPLPAVTVPNETVAQPAVETVVKAPKKKPTQARKPGTFVKGDKRINRTKPGPGQPPIWYKDLLSRYEVEAIDTIVDLMRTSDHHVVRVRAAQDILDRLHGKPTQPIQQVPPVDVSGLTPEEMETLDHLLARVLGDGAGGAQAGTR